MWLLGHSRQSPLEPTFDIDFTPEASRENLDRLSLALTDLGARIRAEGVPEGLPFSHNGASLGAASIWNLVCDAAVFDIAFRPSGFAHGHDDLSQRARAIVVDGVPTQIADLADVVASKRAAGRPKDIAVLPVLEAFLEIRRGEPEIS